MQLFSLSAGLLASTMAVAAEIPVPSTYGTNEAVCALYKEGGSSAIGGSPDGAVIVSPKEVVFLEGGCTPTAVNGNLVSLACSGEGEDWTSEAQIILQGDTLAYGQDDGLTATLQRCPE